MSTHESRYGKPAEFPHTVSAKISDEQASVFADLRSTFDPPTNANALRWLLVDPDVRALIARRVRGEA